jgi:hypothetical protein
MKSHDDEVVSGGVRAESRQPAAVPTSGLLSRVRDALFEPNRAATNAVVTPERIDAREDSLAASMQGTLRELVTRELGPALSEFVLQLEAIRELVPDASMRLRIALSVLSKKQIAARSVQEDLSRVASFLGQQLASFADKVEARRAEHANEQARIDADCSDACSQAEREIAALEAALVAQREALAKATEGRQQRLALLATSRGELDDKERAFRSAQQRLLAEYEGLARELAASSTEKL